MEDAVMMMQPMQPMRIPAALICPRHAPTAQGCPRHSARSFRELICSSFVYPLPLMREVGLRH